MGGLMPWGGGYGFCMVSPLVSTSFPELRFLTYLATRCRGEKNHLPYGTPHYSPAPNNNQKKVTIQTKIGGFERRWLLVFLGIYLNMRYMLF